MCLKSLLSKISVQAFLSCMCYFYLKDTEKDNTADSWRISLPLLYKDVPVSVTIGYTWENEYWKETLWLRYLGEIITWKYTRAHTSEDKIYYYIAINIKWLKMWDKSLGTSVQISLNTGTLTWYWHAYSDALHVAVAWRFFRWRQTSMTSREKLSST